MIKPTNTTSNFIIYIFNDFNATVNVILKYFESLFDGKLIFWVQYISLIKFDVFNLFLPFETKYVGKLTTSNNKVN